MFLEMLVFFILQKANKLALEAFDDQRKHVSNVKGEPST